MGEVPKVFHIPRARPSPRALPSLPEEGVGAIWAGCEACRGGERKAPCRLRATRGWHRLGAWDSWHHPLLPLGRGWEPPARTPAYSYDLLGRPNATEAEQGKPKQLFLGVIAPSPPLGETRGTVSRHLGALLLRATLAGPRVRGAGRTSLSARTNSALLPRRTLAAATSLRLVHAPCPSPLPGPSLPGYAPERWREASPAPDQPRVLSPAEHETAWVEHVSSTIALPCSNVNRRRRAADRSLSGRGNMPMRDWPHPSAIALARAKSRASPCRPARSIVLLYAAVYEA